MMNDAIIIEPPKTATASVIWLHGLGANGHDFEPIVPQLTSMVTHHTRFIFPHAPHRPITINGGMVMPGWYDVKAMDLTVEEDALGIQESEKILKDYIAREIERGISAQHIILAGFSQGGAIALYTGLRYPETLAGIMVLSSYLPLAETLEKQRHEANDLVILFAQAEQSYVLLEKLGYEVEFHDYRMEHQVCQDEIIDINHWLSARLPQIE